MAWIRTVSEDEASGPLAELYSEIASTSGTVANVYRIESLNPAGLRAHMVMYRTLMFGASPLSRTEREAVALVVSATNGCRY